MTARDISSTDTNASRLLKLLPAELTACYLAVRTALDNQTSDDDIYILFFGLILFIMSPFIIRYVMGVKSIMVIVFLSISFFIWQINIDMDRLLENSDKIKQFLDSELEFLPGAALVVSFIVTAQFIKGMLALWAIALVPMFVGRQNQATP